jgi:hypothetical protein
MGGWSVIVQRESSTYNWVEATATEGMGLRPWGDRVIGDSRKVDENIHAEMLAVSWSLLNEDDSENHEIVGIGISRAPCRPCAMVLDALGIDHRPCEGDRPTQG